MTKKNGKDFSTYMSSVLENSMVTGIPQIASAKNKAKKITRAIVFVLCMGGFIYQSKTFLDMYWEYKVVVDVQMSPGEQYSELPSFTICNRHGIQNDPFCEHEPQACSLAETLRPFDRVRVCNCSSYYCDENGNSLNKRLLISYGWTDWKFRSLALEEQKDYLQPLRQMIPYCYLFGTKLGVDISTGLDCDYNTTVSVRAKPNTNGLGNVCYTFNSHISRPDEEIRKVLSTGEIDVDIEPNISQYPPDQTIEPAGIIDVAFHNPYTVLNPYKKGYSLRRTKNYVFRLKKTIRISMPAPYEPNCTDYMALWKLRGGYGPTNQDECLQECFVNVSLAMFDCVPSEVDWPNNFRICYNENTGGLYIRAYACADRNCRQACYEETYDVDLQTIDDIPYPNKDCVYTTRNNVNKKPERISMKIMLNRMETTTYTTKPVFESIETFSYLGGYVGMWLGISLVAVFDFIEAVYILAKYPIMNKCKKKKKNKTKIRKVSPVDVRY